MWNVLRVICVDGSPTLCAATTPTASPGGTMLRAYLTCIRRWKPAGGKEGTGEEERG
jgi:hypothetical protein